MTRSEVQAFVDGLPPGTRKVVAALREVVRTAVVGVEEDRVSKRYVPIRTVVEARRAEIAALIRRALTVEFAG